MSYRTWTYRALFVIPLLLGVLVMLGGASGTGLLADGRHHVVGPSHSGPIAVTPDDRFVWVANPDDDSVTLIDVGGDANRVVDRIRVGDEPQNVVVSPNGDVDADVELDSFSHEMAS